VNGAGAGTVRWIWRSAAVPARVVRALLLPFSALFRAGVVVRNSAFDLGLRRGVRLPRFAIGVGNLSVGGTGKTPVAAWLAAELRRRGVTAGIVLRGYGGDEVVEHRGANPDAAVEADADRRAAASRAVARGAEVLVLDDCLQRRDVPVDAMLVVVSADTWAGPHWPLPAGPWREGIGALRRADLVIVTRKAANREAAEALARDLAPRSRSGQACTAALEPAVLRRLSLAPGTDPAMLAGREVVALSGIGEPELFAEQLRRLGARVTPLAFPDHHAYTAEDVARAARVAGSRWIITTAKDAVKLRALWPSDGPACYVAALGVSIETGAEALGLLLDRAATAARTINPEAAAALPARNS